MASPDRGLPVSPKRKSPRTPTTPNSAEKDSGTPSSSEKSPRSMAPPSTIRMATRLSSKLPRNDSEAEMEVDLESRRGSDVDMAGCSRRDSDVEMGGSRRASDVPMAGPSLEVDKGRSTDLEPASSGSKVTPRRRLRAPFLPEPEIDMAAARSKPKPKPSKKDDMTASTGSKADADMDVETETEGAAVAVALGEAESEWQVPLVWWTGPNMASGAPNVDKPHLTSIIYGSWDKIYVWPGGKPKPSEVKALIQPIPPQTGVKKDGDGKESPADVEENEPQEYPAGIQPLKIPERLIFSPPNKLEAILFACKDNCDWDWDHLAPVKVYHSQTAGKVLLCHLVNTEADVDPALDNTTCTCRLTPLVDKFVILPINEEYLLFYHRYSHLVYSEDHPNDAFLLHKGLPSVVEINHQLEGLGIKKREGKGTFFAKYA